MFGLRILFFPPNLDNRLVQALKEREGLLISRELPSLLLPPEVFVGEKKPSWVFSGCWEPKPPRPSLDWKLLCNIILLYLLSSRRSRLDPSAAGSQSVMILNPSYSWWCWLLSQSRRSVIPSNIFEQRNVLDIENIQYWCNPLFSPLPFYCILAFIGPGSFLSFSFEWHHHFISV